MFPLIWEVTEQEEGMKLGHFLAQKIDPSLSIRFFKRQLENNVCLVNSQIERFASRKLLAKDRIEFKGKLTVEKEKKIPILWEDDSLVALHKPAGIVSDISSLGLKQGYLVHRLDKDTTGILLVAKTSFSKESLRKQFMEKKIKKSYIALVQGKLSLKKGKIEGPYGRKKIIQGNSMWGTVNQGKIATTLFRLIEAHELASLVEVAPLTGKTHQIRSHLQEIGYPVLGDYQYGSRDKPEMHVNRHLLHAWKIYFLHPISKQGILLVANLPQDFLETLEALSFTKAPSPNDFSPSIFWKKEILPGWVVGS